MYLMSDFSATGDDIGLAVGGLEVLADASKTALKIKAGRLQALLFTLPLGNGGSGGNGDWQ
jgi:hypothetical protein